MKPNENIGFTPVDDELVEQLADTLHLLYEEDPYMRVLLDDYEKRVVARLLAEGLSDKDDT